jgi:hypothetical protein
MKTRRGDESDPLQLGMSLKRRRPFRKKEMIRTMDTKTTLREKKGGKRREKQHSTAVTTVITLVRREKEEHARPLHHVFPRLLLLQLRPRLGLLV